MKGIFRLLLIAVAIFFSYKWLDSRSSEKLVLSIPYQFEVENIQVKFPIKPVVDKHSAGAVQIELVRARKLNNQYIIGVTKGGGISESDFYPYSFTNKGAVIRSESEITVKGYSGKEFKLDFNGERVIQRFIKYKTSQINQIAIFAKGNFESGNIQDFMDSITL